MTWLWPCLLGNLQSQEFAGGGQGCLIPPALEDAMSMQAQAERERQARVILGDSERQVIEAQRHDRNCTQHGRGNHATRDRCRTDCADQKMGRRTCKQGASGPPRSMVSLWCFETVKRKCHSSGVTCCRTGKLAAQLNKLLSFGSLNFLTVRSAGLH
jgi:hypothetical protein